MIFKTLTGKFAFGRGGERVGELSLDTVRCRGVLLVVLTLTTGAVDAVTFLRLGKRSAAGRPNGSAASGS